MDEKKINFELAKIIEKKSGVSFSEENDLRDSNFFGFKIHMAVRDLVLIFFDIEKFFNIKIPEEFILEKSFVSFNNISRLIVKLKQLEV